MSLKDLSIDRELIDAQIRNFSSSINITGPKELSKTSKQYTIHDSKDAPNHIATLMIFYNKSGSTTLTPQGKNTELGNSIALHIKDTCTKGSMKPVHISFPNIEQEKFDIINSYLIEECGATVIEQNVLNGKKYTFKGLNDDSINLTYFTNNTLLIQGKQQFLYLDLIEILSNVLDYKVVIEKQINTFDVANNINDTIDEFKMVFPSSHLYLGTTLVSIMSPSLVFKKIDIELTDYAAFAFPMLKGLEGFLKKIFLDYGITITKEGFGEYFNSETLYEGARNLINNGKIVSSVENIYKYYKRNRHGLFHIDGNVEVSKILDNKNDANSVINSVIEIIELSYITIQNEKPNFGKSI